MIINDCTLHTTVSFAFASYLFMHNINQMQRAHANTYIWIKRAMISDSVKYRDLFSIKKAY